MESINNPSYTTDTQRNHQYAAICGFCALLGTFAIWAHSYIAMGIAAMILAACIIDSRRV